MVQTPAMPNTDHPVFAEWLQTLQQVIGTPDDELFLIGHSLGCITILQYLQALPAGQSVGGAVLVAGFAQSLGQPYAETDPFFTKPIDPQTITAHVGHMVAIHSDNDPHVPLAQGDRLARDFGAELIVQHAMGHFSGALKEPGSCTTLPEVAAAVLRMNHIR